MEGFVLYYREGGSSEVLRSYVLYRLRYHGSVHVEDGQKEIKKKRWWT
jgi:hypothetical protein